MPRSLLFFAFFVVFAAFAQNASAAATLKLSPNTGTFEVGSTFTVSLFLDTGGQEINALEVTLHFPPDKLQLVSPSGGKSIIEIWTAQPTYDNEKGEIRLQGGIPGGLNVSQGLITTLTFRAKKTGEALVRFGDESRVLANDGKGTDLLGDTTGGFYTLVLPPPAGPIVSSQTHPDQSKWYSNSTAVLSWPKVEGEERFSYILNSLPVDIPDDISEDSRQSVGYRNLASGTHYFHIKAFRAGSWGGTTHFAINVDTEPPAKFPIEISPAPLTTSRTVLIGYQTTDKLSGIDHYEYAVIPLFEAEQSLFVEGRSPTQLTVEPGKYDVIVRAYDKAGNFQESKQRLRVVAFLPFLFLLLLEKPFWWITLIAVTFVLALFGWRARKWYYHATLRHEQKELPADVKAQLRELQEYRKRYGGEGSSPPTASPPSSLPPSPLHSPSPFAPSGPKDTEPKDSADGSSGNSSDGSASGETQKLLQSLLLIMGSSLFLLGAAFPGAYADEEEVFAPPVITTVSQDISNEDIFYVGGKTAGGNIEVTIYLQDLQTGETISRKVISDKTGNWFYRHDSFLSSGKYLLWIQARLGDLVSPPSPRIELEVQQTALQLGASRISFETFYLLAALLFFAINVGLVGYIVIHVHNARRRHAAWLKEVYEAEQSVRRGFAVLKRDIEAELALIRKIKLSKELSAEEKQREEQLLKDLAWAEQYIGKEIWDVERAEHTD